MNFHFRLLKWTPTWVEIQETLGDRICQRELFGGAVKKSGSEIVIKEEKWQHIDPCISFFWALPINHYFYSLYALWGFLIWSHTTKISPSEKGCWALDRNSMWGIVQLLNSKTGTFLEKDGPRIWRGGGLWTRWQSPVDDYLVSPSLFHRWDC